MRPGRLEGGIRLERHLAPRRTIAHAGHRHRQFLIGQVDRSALGAPPHHVGALVHTRVLRTGERRHFRDQCLLHGFQAERIQRQRRRRRHGAIVQWDRLLPVRRAARWFFAACCRTLRMGGVLRNELRISAKLISRFGPSRSRVSVQGDHAFRSKVISGCAGPSDQ